MAHLSPPFNSLMRDHTPQLLKREGKLCKHQVAGGTPQDQILVPTVRHWAVVKGDSLLVSHRWRWERQQLQFECVCTQQERVPETAMLNALGIDRAIHVAAKWTLMYYKVPVGAAQTKLFSLQPIYQEGIIYWGEQKKKSWFLNWAKLQCHDREGAQVRLTNETKYCIELLGAPSSPIPTATKLGLDPGGSYPKQRPWVQISITHTPLVHKQPLSTLPNHGAISVC